MTVSREYTTRRSAVVTSLCNLMQSINGTGSFRSTINPSSIFPILKFYDDIHDFPTICVTASSESRVYQSAGYKDRYLDIRIMIYINQENPLEACEAILEDIETLIEDNGRLAYIDRDGNTQYTHDITVLALSTDEGTLDPISIGEMSIRVHY